MTGDFDADDEIVVKLVTDSGEAAAQPSTEQVSDDAAKESGRDPSPLMNDAPLVLLYLNVLIIATCGLVYELLAGTLASYVLGDSVTQFSLIIGVYLSALGAGA